MYQIAICDDEMIALNMTEHMLNVYEKIHSQYKFSIQCFTSASLLLEKIKEKPMIEIVENNSSLEETMEKVDLILRKKL